MCYASKKKGEGTPSETDTIHNFWPNFSSLIFRNINQDSPPAYIVLFLLLPTIPLTLPAIILFLEPTLTLNYSFYNLESDRIVVMSPASTIHHYLSQKRSKAILSLSMPLSLPYRYKLSSRQRKWR